MNALEIIFILLGLLALIIMALLVAPFLFCLLVVVFALGGLVLPMGRITGPILMGILGFVVAAIVGLICSVLMSGFMVLFGCVFAGVALAPKAFVFSGAGIGFILGIPIAIIVAFVALCIQALLVLLAIIPCLIIMVLSVIFDTTMALLLGVASLVLFGIVILAACLCLLTLVILKKLLLSYKPKTIIGKKVKSVVSRIGSAKWRIGPFSKAQRQTWTGLADQVED